MGSEDAILEFLRKMPRRGGISIGKIIAEFVDTYREKTVYNSIARLKKKKHVMYEGRQIVISERGRRKVIERTIWLPVFDSCLDNSKKRELLVMFDIPENRKAERDWFRRQLMNLGFTMIQKSVWLGPSPIPQDFKRYLDVIGLGSSIRMFLISSEVTKTQ